MSKQEILDREARWARPAGIAALLGVALYLGSILIEQGASLLDRDNDATRLATFHDNSTALLGTAIMFGVGVALLSVPLFYLFKASEARGERVRRALVPFAFIGPLILGAQSIVAWFANRQISDDFVAGVGSRTGDAANDFAKDLVDNSSLADVAGGLVFPALLGIIIAMVYIALQAMRLGLLTRFWGSLGMALGVSLALIPPVALLGSLIWFVYLGLLIAGWVPGGRPPAWAAGEAIPWLKPGEEPEEAGAAGGGTVEGSGRELSEPPLPEGEGSGGQSQAPGETQGQQRKKRKRRG